MEFEVDVIRNDLDRLKMLGEKEREELLLLSVMKKKDNNLVEMLLNLGTRADAMNEDNDSALVLACDKDNVEAIKLLVENGANVNYTGSSLGTPLYLACQNENKAVISYLVDRGARINDSSNYNRETPLIQACRSMNIDIVKFLIKEGADVNVSNAHGVTPISLMCRCVGRGYEGAYSIAKLLVRSGANLNIVEKDEITTPLLIASRYRSSKLVSLLVENGAWVNPNYDELVKQFIKHTIDNMYPSLRERREIKEALRARDIEGFGACLYQYLEISKLNNEENNVESLKRIHRMKKYIYSLKDGEEFREVIREIRDLRKLISMSRHDRFLCSKIAELNKKLEVDMEIFNLVNKMQVKLESLEYERCLSTNGRRVGLNIINRRKLGKTLRPSL